MPKDMIESGGVFWTREEYDELSDLGEQGVTNHNVSALNELWSLFALAGSTEKMLEIETAMNAAIDGWTQDIKGITGVDVTFDPALYGGVGGWRESETGQFVGKLDFSVFGSKDTDYMQYLVDKMSPWL